MLQNFRLAFFKITLRVRETVFLPPVNKGNTLRGAFGMSFQRLVCFTPQQCRNQCQNKTICAYGMIFEASPPPDAERLRANQDIPRPFVIRPPLTPETVFEPGSRIEFEVGLFGKAIEFFPYFAATFRMMAEQGLGPTRGRLSLERITALDLQSGETETVFTAADPVFRNSTRVTTAADLVSAQPLKGRRELTLEFLTPTVVRADGQLIDRPDFHHLFKRLRDRINALSYFYCGEAIDIDYKGLGVQAEGIKTINRTLHWENRSRRSYRTRQHHEMGGFIGSLTFVGDFTPFWPFLVLGQHTHLGRYAVWGNGWYRLFREGGSQRFGAEARGEDS